MKALSYNNVDAIIKIHYAVEKISPKTLFYFMHQL